MEPKSKRKPDELLMDAFGFDEDDLAANRAGKLSARQRANLEAVYRDTRHTKLYRSLVGILITTVILTGILLFPQGFNDLLSIVQAFSIIGLLALGVAAFAVRNSLRKANPLFDDLKDGLVKPVEGRVQLDVVPPLQTSRTFKPPPLYLAIEDQGWRIDRDTFLAFKNGDPYAIYYAPHSRTILSVEWLRDPMTPQAPTDSTDALEITSSEKRKRDL